MLNSCIPCSGSSVNLLVSSGSKWQLLVCTGLVNDTCYDGVAAAVTLYHEDVAKQTATMRSGLLELLKLFTPLHPPPVFLRTPIPEL
mmetsp:Transcript_20944/g.33899  ORF Transcript_20944/g.33899 Transcript_20944/m.33899 type:complete len:87 (-) Transcript_20944:88-348(-)